MKITVRSEGFNLRIPIPTGLIFNDLTAGLAPHFLEKNGVTITKKQARTFIRTLRKFKRRHRNWTLVEVESANGDYVEIKL